MALKGTLLYILGFPKTLSGSQRFIPDVSSQLSDELQHLQPPAVFQISPDEQTVNLILLNTYNHIEVDNVTVYFIM